MPKRSRPLPGPSTRKSTGKKAVAPVPAPAPVAAQVLDGTPGPALKVETFDDKHIITDIRKTGIIAGAIFAILIALSVVLR